MDLIRVSRDGLLTWECFLCHAWYQRRTEDQLKMRVKLHYHLDHDGKWAPWH